MESLIKKFDDKLEEKPVKLRSYRSNLIKTFKREVELFKFIDQKRLALIFKRAQITFEACMSEDQEVISEKHIQSIINNLSDPNPVSLWELFGFYYKTVSRFITPSYPVELNWGENNSLWIAFWDIQAYKIHLLKDVFNVDLYTVDAFNEFELTKKPLQSCIAEIDSDKKKYLMNLALIRHPWNSQDNWISVRKYYKIKKAKKPSQQSVDKRNKDLIELIKSEAKEHNRGRKKKRHNWNDLKNIFHGKIDKIYKDAENNWKRGGKKGLVSFRLVARMFIKEAEETGYLKDDKPPEPTVRDWVIKWREKSD